MAFLVDSNIILDIVTEDPKWSDWSSATLAECSEEGRLWINPLIYAEVSVGFSRIEDLDDVIPHTVFTVLLFHLKQFFWQGSVSCSIEKPPEQKLLLCLIFISALTQRFPT